MLKKNLVILNNSGKSISPVVECDSEVMHILNVTKRTHGLSCCHVALLFLSLILISLIFHFEACLCVCLNVTYIQWVCKNFVFFLFLH